MVNKKKKPIKKTPYDIRQNTAYFVKNRLPAFILAGMFIFWTIASIFGLIGYCRSKPKNTAMVTANAQTIDDINRRYWDIDLTLLEGACVVTENYDGFVRLTDSFRVVAYDNEIQLHCGPSYYSFGGEYDTIKVEGYPFHLMYGDATAIECELDFQDITENIDFNTYVPYEVTYSYLYNQASFYNSITVAVVFAEEQDITRTRTFYFTLSFYTESPGVILGYHVDFERSYSITTPAYGVDIYSATTINTLYEQAKGGYEQGYARGETIGYQNGKNDGYVNGKQEGYALGLQASNNASFESLMSAVFDVPIRAFTSLFNFDLLGVNLANFFLSILTLCVVLAVVKMLI